MQRNQGVGSEWVQRLPLRIDSVGVRLRQDNIHRATGYFCYHWIHTIRGVGEFEVRGHAYTLQPRQGVLVPPHEPHRYKSLTPEWDTWFLTFDGVTASSIVNTLDIPLCVPLTWDDRSPVDDIHVRLETHLRADHDFAGINGSLEVYSFLVQLKKYMRVSGQPSLSHWHQRLLPLLTELESSFSDPTLDLGRMAGLLQVSPQRLNRLFHGVFGVSPYRYLVQLRINKAKELLFSRPSEPIYAIAQDVGFTDPSHFVATFRRMEGLPPEQFRLQYFR